MKNNMNNKGFTLIELLAVFVILISVSFIAVNGITASLDKQDIRECESQQELAVSAAKMYFSLDGKDVDQINVGVTVYDLIDKGYIKDDVVIDKINSSDVIKAKSDYSGYTYNSKDVGCSCSNTCG